MKKNAIAIACTAVLALVLFLPFGLMGQMHPESAVRDQVTLDVGDPVTPNEQEAPVGEPAEQLAEELKDVEYVPDVVLVGIADGVSVDQVNERLQSLDYISTDAVSESDLQYGYAELPLAEGVKLEEAIVKLEQEDFVIAAQPNYIYHLLDVDDSQSVQSSSEGSDAIDGQGGNSEESTGSLVAQHIDMGAQATAIDDPLRSKQWGLQAIKAYDAWDVAKASHSITVAVIDSGIDMDHPDFKLSPTSSNIVRPYSVLQKKAGGDTSNVKDLMGHGTHVAGIIAAGTSNGVGVAGVSYNAYVMPIQVIEYNTSTRTNSITSADAAAGVNYAVAHRNDDPAAPVRVINISFGTTERKVPSDYDDRALMSALTSAHKANILVVYAAGNGGRNGAYACFPCDADPYGIGVISVKQNGSVSNCKRTDSSNYNEAGMTTKELSAPGDSIHSTWINSTYADDNGTSMAAPFVSGTAALMFAANKDLTADNAKDILCATALDLNTSANISGTTFDLQTGYGLVNAKDAVSRAKNKQYTPAAVKPITGATVTLSSSSYTYDGAAKKPSVTRVTLSDGTVLGNGDYKVLSYSNNVGAGTASVTVGGIGNYAGTASATFKINAAHITAKLSATSYVYDGKVKNPTVYVYGPKAGKQSQLLSAASDYTVVSPAGRTKAGTYTYRVTGRGNYTGTASVSFTISKNSLEVFAGSNRYDTACRIAQAECALPGASYAGVIVCSCNEGKFPDALSAAGLSGVLGYPVVTVNGSGLTTADRKALAALKAKCPSGSLNILVVGGTSAVSTDVQAALGSYGRVSARLGGTDRYDTNRLVYEYGASHGRWSTTRAFLASGANFPDALTIAPYLVRVHCPIVLVNPDAASLSSAQRSAVSRASQVIALGGESSVPHQLLSQAASASAGHSSSRLGGSNRYETSAAIVRWELGQGMTLSGAGFATGQNFPDALASSYLLGSRGSVLGLVSSSGSNTQMLAAVRSAVSSTGVPASMRVFGGTTSVSATVRAQLASAAGWSSYAIVSK